MSAAAQPTGAPSCASSAPPRWRDRLTVIVTTSPLPRHPCSRMLEAVLRSLQHFGGLRGCRVILVADGYDACIEEGGMLRWKKGKIDDDAAARYERHKWRVRAACAAGRPPFEACELMEQPEHRGFALGVRRAVVAADTEYVLVVQHDTLEPVFRTSLKIAYQPSDLQPAGGA